MAKDSVGMKGRAGTQSGVAPKNRLDSRMSELDRNIADMKAGKARLTIGPNGKFQFVSTTSSAPKPAASKPAASKPAASKPAASKPAASKPAVPKFAASKALLEGFKDVDEAEVPDNSDRSASSTNALMEGYSGRKGTGVSSTSIKNFTKASSPSPTPIRKRTLEDLQKEGKETKFYKDAVNENKDKLKEDMANVALTGASLLGPGMALRGARAGYNAYKGYKAARAAGNAARTVEGTFLPRETARLSGPRVAGVQNRLSGPKPTPSSPKPDTVYVNPRGEASGSRTAVGTKQLPAPYKKPKPSVPKRREVIRINEKGDEVYSIYNNYRKGGKVKKFAKGGISGDPDMGSSTDQSKDPEFRKKMLKDQISGDPDMGSSKDESKSPSFRKKMLGGEKKYAAGGKVKKMAGGGMFGSVPVGAAKPPYGGPRPGSVQPKPSMGGKPPYTGPRPGSAQPKPPAVSPGIRKGIGEAIRSGMGAPDMGALARAPKAYGMKKGGKVGESKSEVEREIKFMRAKGAPRRMIEGEIKEKEAKGMKCGGMAKYGRGGGIERRGSGAGTVIKGYKSGGMVDGCAQRGKTKGKVC